MIKFKYLEKAFKKLFFLLLLFLWQFSVLNTFASVHDVLREDQQTVELRGTIKDTSGEPLPGVTIVEKGTKNGTISDLDGAFMLKVKPSAVISLTYLGFAPQEIDVSGRTSIEIVMHEESSDLNEVVIVGYGTQRRGNVLSSISTIDAQDLARTTTTTTSGALVGKMAGITNRQGSGTPGASTNISIRNMGTPLFVIDGVIKDEGQFNNLDVNDIESISILKDGAAAIYGVKASNGVVLVKTKRGNIGKTDIGVNIYTGWQQWARFPDMANAYEFTRADYERRINSGEYVDVDKAKVELEKWRTGYYNPETGEDYRGYDWTDFARKDAPITYYSVNASGGSEKVNYYIAISRIDQDAVFKDYNFNRNNIQTNLDAEITKNLKVSFSMNGRIETRDNPGLIGDDDYWNARFGMMRNLPTHRPYANDNEDYPAYLSYAPELNLATMRKDISGFYEDTWRVFQGNWGLEYTSPIPELTAKFTYGYYYAQHSRDNFEKSYDTYAYDYENQMYVSKWSKTDSWMQKESGAVEEHTLQFQVNYAKTFNEAHNISAVLAAESYKRNTGTLRIAQNPTESNILPILTDNRDLIAYLYDTYWEGVNAGFAGRFAYDYLSKYLIEVSGRYDGSYRFPSANRWGLFPSVALGYRISEEDYFKNSKLGSIFDNLKFRFSYGVMGDDLSGNSLYPDFAYMGGYSFNRGTIIMTPDPGSSVEGSVIKGSSARAYPTEELSWAKSKMVNIGLDMSFLNNRLSAEVDVYKRSRTGLPATRSDLTLPSETGLSVPPENLNSDKIMGVDGFLKWNDKVRDFDYFVGVNATFARKKNGEVYGQRFNNSWDEYRWSNSNRWANVYGGSNVWATKIIGRFQSQEEIDNYPVIMDDQGNRTVLPGDFIYEDTNGDGRIDGYDERPLGYGEDLPYFTYGINLGFEWKGIDFAVDFAGASMQTIILDWEAKWPFQNGGNSPKYMLNDRWHHEDIFDPTSPWVAGERPAIRMDSWREGGSYRRWNSYFMSNTNYIRLKNLVLGYTFPKAWTSKATIQKLRLYIQGTNLFSFDNMRKYELDPEPYGRNGLDYPPHRVLTIGANVVF